MNKLRLYKIDIEYIKYLYSFDNRVQYNPSKEEKYSERRPYLGIVLEVNEFKYFVPLEHPRKSHKEMKNNIFIFKIHNGKYGILGFNNMIPVKEEQLINFDINKEKKSYKQILVSQYRFCNKHIKEIREKAKETYNKSIKNSFYKKVCCNFKLLEEKCNKYKEKVTMKVLFATTNQAKVEKYKKALEEKGIELITINDLDFKLDINENGKNAIENAYIKAKAYYERTKIPTIGMDNCLFIEGVPEEKQPGTHVRRVNGKELTDEEMIEYYTNLVKEYGGKLLARWIFGIVICNEKGVKKYSYSKSDFYFVDKPCKKRIQGYPLDSISVMPENNKYWLELTDEEKRSDKNDDTEFIINNI